MSVRSRRAEVPLDAFMRDGAVQVGGAALAILNELRQFLNGHTPEHAGTRIFGLASSAPWLAATGPIGAIAAMTLGPSCRPVRAILFDKSAATNWSLGWHQDRTIAVRGRADVHGFGPWTIKQGMHHVAPPADLLACMVTLRVHLDDVPDGNAPLLVAPGSHRLGRIAEADIAETVKRCGTMICTAEAGDVWLYSTPILHMSERAERPTRRRVLQVDYAAKHLPPPLEWLGV